MFALPANVAAFTAPALPGFSMPQIKPFNTLSVLDDAKDKAKQLESSAKKEFSKAESAIKAKVPESAGGSKIELYSGKFYAVSALGGIVACGATHTLVTPLDLVKCRRQVDKTLYSGNVDGWKKIYAADGFRGLYTGWTPTALGYSMQGACKYGFYEFFKKYYSDLAGPTNAKKYKDAIYLAGSASAEFIADVALVPMEAVKVRIQTSTNPVFARGISDGVSKFVAAEGAGGLFKSLPSLWSRQIPYTMMKFWSFEATVAKIYASLGKPKQSYNKLQQLGVSFVGGYIAGVFCAIVSHPADTMVSKLNASSKTGVKPTVGSIYSEIGFGGLWAGLGTRIVMIGTLTALQWLIYDSFKTAFGLPTTGAAEPDAKPAAGAIASKLH